LLSSEKLIAQPIGELTKPPATSEMRRYHGGLHEKKISEAFRSDRRSGSGKLASSSGHHALDF